MSSEAAGGAERLSDAYGRVVTDLRVSVTKRCNFKCVYCHNEGLGPVAGVRALHSDEMTADEIEERLEIARAFGIRTVKFTGGEPLVRSDLEEILRRAARHMDDISLTTNGSLLAPRAAALRAAGLARINVSVDALDAQAFQKIRQGNLAPVLEGIRAALAAGIAPVKLNLVVFQETLRHIPEVLDFVRHTPGLRLQLIEFMPEQTQHPDWTVDIRALREELSRRADRVIVRAMHHRRIYDIQGASVELVDPVENADFCANCRRLRMTHDGKLKGCLNRGDDLAATRGLSPDGIREAFRRVARERVPYYGVYVKAPALPDGVVAAAP